MIKLDPLRIIEIDKFGRFYVMGFPPYIVCEAPDADPDRAGFIIIQEKYNIPAGVSSNIHLINCLIKLVNETQGYRTVIKNRETAEEICYACNRIQVNG